MIDVWLWMNYNPIIPCHLEDFSESSQGFFVMSKIQNLTIKRISSSMFAQEKPATCGTKVSRMYVAGKKYGFVGYSVQWQICRRLWYVIKPKHCVTLGSHEEQQ